MIILSLRHMQVFRCQYIRCYLFRIKILDACSSEERFKSKGEVMKLKLAQNTITCALLSVVSIFVVPECDPFRCEPIKETI